MVTASLLGACAYQPDSFRSTQTSFHGTYLSVGCLDLAIERRADLADGQKVLGFEFGNRCDWPSLVDLSTVGVIGRTAEGRSVTLVAFDPERELRPLRIDARAVGREAIAYSSDADITSVCVDAASIAHASPARWLCFQGN